MEQKQTEDDTISNKLNPDFVNLARNENMIHVDGLSYAKLGVMGQGASCKVYILYFYYLILLDC